MGDNPETDNWVVEPRTPIEANHTEDMFYYLSVGKGEIFRVEISIEVCCENRFEDRRCDLIIELQEALSQTMVGRFGLTQKVHLSEYHGPLQFTYRGPLEEP